MPCKQNGRGTPLRFFVPINGQWEAAVCSEHRMEAAFLLNLIHWKWMCWRGDDDGWVRLKKAYLRRVIRRDVLPVILQQLVQAEIIDWDEHYCNGKSMRYRLRPEFRQTRMIRCDDRRLTGRIRLLQEEDECRLLPVHRWLRDRLLMLEFDLERARSIVDGMIPDDDSPLTVTGAGRGL